MSSDSALQGQASPDRAAATAPAPKDVPLAQHRLVFGSVLDLIGRTPLLQIPADLMSTAPRKLRASPAAQGAAGARVWGKLEHFNPAGSVKDRIALAMLRAAERSGRLAPGGVVIEPTSGNTGIALAQVCARLGYRCLLTMPASMSLERRALLEALGAELVLTDAQDQMAGAIAKAEDLAQQLPGAFMPQQFDNPDNPAIHRETTGPELLEAFAGERLDAFVAGVGTGGTITGVGSLLRQERPDCRIVAVEPESCATISRGERGPSKIQGLAAGFVPRNFDRSVPHEVVTVSDEEAYRTKRQLAARVGLLVGISAGGAVHAALRVAHTLPASANVVVVLPDTGERYFSLDEYFAHDRG